MHWPSILCQAVVYKIETEKSIVEVGLSLLSKITPNFICIKSSLASGGVGHWAGESEKGGGGKKLFLVI